MTDDRAREVATRPSAAPRDIWLHLCVGVALLILCGLGVWQLERLQWKTEKLARIAAAAEAPPEPLGAVLARLQDHVDVDYVRVQAFCPELETKPVVRLYVVESDGPAKRAIAACSISVGPYQSLLVDRGVLKATTSPTSSRTLDQPMVGVLRAGEVRSFLTPDHQGPGSDWYVRDIAAMAAELHAPSPAPVMLMLEGPVPASGDPKPQPVPINLPNNHLNYALTWFGLAFALLAVYIARLRRRG